MTNKRTLFRVHYKTDQNPTPTYIDVEASSPDAARNGVVTAVKDLGMIPFVSKVKVLRENNTETT